MKKLMWIVSIGSMIITAIAMQFMPESVPMHYDMAGNVDRWGSKYENLIFPIIILALALFMSLLIRFYEKKAATLDEKSQAGNMTNIRTIGIIGAVTTIVFGLMQCFLLYGAYAGAKTEATQAVVDIGKVSCILLGIILIIMGNFMTKTRINGSIGIRISWSMYNDTTWRKSNRFGAIAMIVAGLLTVLSAAFMKSSFGATMAALGYICLATIATTIYAHKVYVQELQSER